MLVTKFFPKMCHTQSRWIMSGKDRRKAAAMAGSWSLYPTTKGGASGPLISLNWSNIHLKLSVSWKACKHSGGHSEQTERDDLGGEGRNERTSRIGTRRLP